MSVRKRYVRNETPESRMAIAVTKPNSRNTEALLAQGVNANLRYDRYPILFSATLPNIRVLHTHGANLDLQSDNGYTLLNELCHRHQSNNTRLNATERIQFLLENGADPNLSDKTNGNTPLHNLCSFSIDPVIIRLLLQHGADPNIQNSAGETPLHRLASNIFIFMQHPNLPYQESIDALLEGGANPRMRDEDHHLPSEHGRTIFMDLARRTIGSAEQRMIDYLEATERSAPLSQEEQDRNRGEPNETNANRSEGGSRRSHPRRHPRRHSRRHSRRQTHKRVVRKRQGRTRRRH
jgi:hypothetical protein